MAWNTQVSRYVDRSVIQLHVSELVKVYEQRRGGPISFPIDSNDIAEKVFDLEVIYDSEGVLNGIGPDILGATYPNGHLSPWGRDKVIAVNITKREGFDPTIRSDNFTIAHECAGHYVLHYLKGVMGEQYRGPRSCTSRKDPFEWQADFAAGELLMPQEKVSWFLDGKLPQEIINLDVYGSRFKEYFGANQMMMETRLHVLDYKLLNGKYDWANHSSGEPRRSFESHRAATTSGARPRTRTSRQTPYVDTKMMMDALKLKQELNRINGVADPFGFADLNGLFAPYFEIGSWKPKRTPPKRRQ